MAKAYHEAARVCLSRHHVPPTTFTVRSGRRKTDAAVSWPTPTPRIVRAWANRDGATRDAAYLCVIAAVELLDGRIAVSRAETTTGADYYIWPAGHTGADLEDCWRLEVSGINDGSEADVARRLREKVEQARAGASNLPALAGVIGFFARLIALKTAS